MYKPIVVDIGGSTTKSGVAGDVNKMSVVPTTYDLVSDPSSRNISQSTQLRGFIIDSAGFATDPDGFLSVLTTLAQPDCPMLVTMPHTGSFGIGRERCASVLFEKADLPAVHFESTTKCSLLSTNRTSGVVLESGHNATHIVPFIDGMPQEFATKRLPFAGRHVTDYAMHLFTCAGFLHQDFPRDGVAAAKEALCFVLQDDEEIVDHDPYFPCYELPDGKIIYLGVRSHEAPMMLWDPTVIDRDDDMSLPIALLGVINHCQEHTQLALWQNIVLSGGNTLLKGLPERLQKEMTRHAPYPPPNVWVNVVAQPKRQIAAWIGGSLIASTPRFPLMCITKQEYDEVGPHIVRRRKYL